MALTRIQLDAAGCSRPDCGHDHSELFLHSRCHLGANCTVFCDNGECLVRCAGCGRPIALIAVATNIQLREPRCAVKYTKATGELTLSTLTEPVRIIAVLAVARAT